MNPGLISILSRISLRIMKKKKEKIMIQTTKLTYAVADILTNKLEIIRMKTSRSNIEVNIFSMNP